ncbi:tRNA pseudouridine(55) synthase TruB [Peptoniphilus equinus]|uniref:tRNA pseudouridine synthase B n=1 Tax=Peptoniphilus equinus TaxID=3016343 RepID=A0ABY7QW77_9FIRM|nr:tRNA pseudouridine(55) synthase TruB [Peptoniphilus equinus]WBW50681.1 tRNA pseudouridine(55) synthase TruB [Peptoniphilus equinus]
MNGVLLINKPKDMTSHDVVYSLRKKLQIKKIGHAGTLDPMAEGVLVMLIGQGTKLSDYLLSKSKTYLAEFELGYETDTLDSTGEVVSSGGNTEYSRDEIQKVFESLSGDILQVPPIYSAIKVKGKKLYDYARSGEAVDIQSRHVTIYDLNMVCDAPLTLQTTVSSGTYIRSLIRDIGHALGTYATMTGLVRQASGTFTLDHALSLESISDMTISDIEKALIPMDQALGFEPVVVPDHLYKRITNGLMYFHEGFEADVYYNVYCRNTYIGIGKYSHYHGQWGLKIVKNLLGVNA